jgi:hypothetical protein
MNGGGDDDFFFNNNNRQRQLTISTNSSTTSTTTTVIKRFRCRQCRKSYVDRTRLRYHVEAVWVSDIDARTVGISSTIAQRWRTIFVECAYESRFSAIDVESALRSAIGWPTTRCGTSRSIWIGTSSGSIRMRIRASTAATTLSAADVRTHILADQSTNSHSKSQ